MKAKKFSFTIGQLLLEQKVSQFGEYFRRHQQKDCRY